MPEAVSILFYAVLAAASPVTLIATLVVLGTADARVNGIAFAAGFILGQAAGLGIPLIVGLIVTDVGEGGSASDWFELALGVLMLLAASRMQRNRGEPIPDESRAAALLVRLERVDLKTAFSIGIPLGIGAKRLLIAILAASTIALEATSRAAELQQASLYVIVASILVWLPVTVYFIVGEPADEWVEVSKRWLLANQREVSFYLALIFGVSFTVDAVVKLLS
jgi:Sap-like sulfolipid-1-addressing protein